MIIVGIPNEHPYFYDNGGMIKNKIEQKRF